MRVIVFGLGNMGSETVRLLAGRSSFEVVGAICRRPENEGRDVGEIAGIGPLGVTASRDVDAVLDRVEADAVVHTSDPRIAIAEPELAKLVGAGLNVVTLTEEAAYPWSSHPEESRRLDEQARSKGVSLLGTGVSPGFLWDTLVSVLTLASPDVSRIKVTRRSSLSPLSDRMLVQMGVGLEEADFDEAVRRGDVPCHVGSRQSLDMVGAALGWTPRSYEQATLAVLRDGDSPPDPRAPGDGLVCGFRQPATALFDEGSFEVDLAAQLGEPETYDQIEIEGSAPLRMRIAPAVGAMAAPAVAVNVLPDLIAAEPGLRSMLDLPLPRAQLGEPTQPTASPAGTEEAAA